MTIKKKLGLGVASAALGLTLVGGGTFAAFNDVVTINNHFASGTLDLAVIAKGDGKPINFDLSNMKPGDSVERIFTLKNNGSLAIKEVLFKASAGNFKIGDTAGTDGAMHEFLSQFQIDVFEVDRHTEALNSIFNPNAVATLSELVNGSYLTKVKPSYKGSVDGTLNLSHLIAPYPNSVEGGLPAGDLDDVHIKISFIDNKADKDAKGEYIQNKFQNNKVDFKFHLEATQWDGVEIRVEDRNGAVNNGVQYSADGDQQPNPRTIEKNNGIGEAVTDDQGGQGGGNPGGGNPGGDNQGGNNQGGNNQGGNNQGGNNQGGNNQGGNNQGGNNQGGNNQGGNNQGGNNQGGNNQGGNNQGGNNKGGNN